MQLKRYAKLLTVIGLTCRNYQYFVEENYSPENCCHRAENLSKVFKISELIPTVRSSSNLMATTEIKHGFPCPDLIFSAFSNTTKTWQVV